ncbi:MAG: hypothetical protein KF726_11745 [Anaerolineae bacterium]|nr:hypothetical protein [Anaerolineae bacterium]
MTSTPQAAPNYVSVGGIFIDDIVYPDGHTSMEILGGGGVHTCAGIMVWDEKPGLVATIGLQMPAALLARMNHDFDMQGVLEVPYPQIRAWQLFEWDGKRTEIFRVEVSAPFMDEPLPEQMPTTYHHAKAVSILRNGSDVASWRQRFSADTIIMWEPEQAYMTADNRADFVATLPHTQIVSPNLLESSLLYGINDPHALIDAMLNDGATIVSLRMGEKGSLVASRQVRYHIPAVPVPQIVDQTGAGNTYSGGFLVGWARSHDLKAAGCYGAVSASFALEHIGVLQGYDAAERDRRLAWALDQAQEVANT